MNTGSKPKWLTEIQSEADSVPYGEVVFGVNRVNRHTTKVTTVSSETLRYQNNPEAMTDIQGLLATLIDEGYTGKVQLQLDLQTGQIRLLTITNTRETKYEARRPKQN